MIVELVPPHTGRAYDAMRELRPSLTSRAAFVEQVDERQRAAGYRLVGSMSEDGDQALAVAGFRVTENLGWGRHVYDEAARLGIRQVHLDSGVGAERAAAHGLYFASGYRISCYHFDRQG